MAHKSPALKPRRTSPDSQLPLRFQQAFSVPVITNSLSGSITRYPPPPLGFRPIRAASGLRSIGSSSDRPRPEYPDVSRPKHNAAEEPDLIAEAPQGRLTRHSAWRLSGRASPRDVALEEWTGPGSPLTGLALPA